MRVQGRWIWLPLLPALFISTIAYAGEQKLSLRDCLLQAMKGNPEIRARDHGLLADREDVRIARSFLLPRITFEERFMRTNNPTYAFMAKLNQERFAASDFDISALNDPDPISDFQTSISFEQALFAPKAYIGREMAKKEYEARQEEVSRKREEVAFMVFRTYLDVQTARSFLSVAEKGVEDAREHHRIAESRYKVGLGLYSDMLRAEVAVRSAEERKVTAEKNLLVSKRALGLMIGLAESVNVDEQRPTFKLNDLAHYSALAQSRKDLKGMEARYQNAENNLRMASSSYLPVLGIGGSYQMNSHKAVFGEEGESWQAMAFLRWELFDGLKRESERAKAQHKLAEAGEYLDGMRKKVSFEVYEAYLSVEESRKGLELAKASMASAEEGRRLVRTRYEKSLSTMVDMLDVQTNLDATRADVVAREAAYLTSLARLSHQSGTILKDLEIEP
jgi:outer membrane protein TolC